MRPARLPWALPAALPLAALTLLALAEQAAPAAVPAVAVAASAAEAPAGVRVPGRQAELRAGRPLATPSVVQDGSTTVAAPTATFTVTYVNFSAPAKAAFQRAVTMWANNVVSSVPITIRAEYTALGPGVLGSAGSNYYWRDNAAFPRKGTWYPDPLANKLACRQLDPSPDIVASFSSSFSNWHFGSTPAPSGAYDFTSVVAHEIGHGLGFAGFGRLVSSGTQGSVRLSDGQANAPSIYDRFTEGAGGTLLSALADPSAALKTAMTNGALFFDSTPVRNANGGKPARLFAPATFQPGSSYSHLDEATFRAGSVHSLMTPQIGAGETIRSPGAITKAIFKTQGW